MELEFLYSSGNSWSCLLSFPVSFFWGVIRKQFSFYPWWSSNFSYISWSGSQVEYNLIFRHFWESRIFYKNFLSFFSSSESSFAAIVSTDYRQDYWTIVSEVDLVRQISALRKSSSIVWIPSPSLSASLQSFMFRVTVSPKYLSFWALLKSPHLVLTVRFRPLKLMFMCSVLLNKYL